MRSQKTMALCLLFSLFLGFSFSYDNTDNNYINFEKNSRIDLVLDKAAKENKPVFLDFYGNWCKSCFELDEQVFRTQEVATYMNDNFINFKIDAGTYEGKYLVSRYKVVLLPGLIILNPKGDVVKQASKYMEAQEFLRFAKDAKLLSN